MGWYCLILSSFSMSRTAPFSTALTLSSAESFTPTAARRTPAPAPAPAVPAVLLYFFCLPRCLSPPDRPPEAVSPWAATARLARLEVVQARRVIVPLNIVKIYNTGVMYRISDISTEESVSTLYINLLVPPGPRENNKTSCGCQANPQSSCVAACGLPGHWGR